MFIQTGMVTQSPSNPNTARTVLRTIHLAPLAIRFMR